MIDRAKLTELIDRGLCRGMGVVGGPVCIEAAIALAAGEPLNDKPACVHPVIRAHAIRLNDAVWGSSAARSAGLREYAFAQLNTTHLDGVEFVRRLALRTIREVLPIALNDAGLTAEAQQCRNAGDLEAARAAARAAAQQCRNAGDLEAAWAAAWAAVWATAWAAEAAAVTAVWAAAAAEAAAVTAVWAAAAAAEAAAAEAAAAEALSLSARIACEIIAELRAGA